MSAAPRLTTEQSIIVQQRARIEEQAERIRQLEDAIAPESITVAPAWRLTASEAMVYRSLARTKETVRTDTLFLALYGDRIDDLPDAKILDVLICKVRAKLKTFGCVIETDWGVGYRMAQLASDPGNIIAIPNRIADEAQEMIDHLVALAIGKTGSRGVGKVFVAIVRHLAAADGMRLNSRELGERIYEGWRRPKYETAVIAMAVRKGRPVLAEHGWEIASQGGHMGGYWLRKIRRKEAA